MTRGGIAAALAVALVGRVASADDSVPAFLRADGSAFAHLLPGQGLYLTEADHPARPIRGTGGAEHATVIESRDGVVRLRVWDPVATVAFYVDETALATVAVRATRLVARPSALGQLRDDSPGVAVEPGERLPASAAQPSSAAAVRVAYESELVTATGFVRRHDVGRIFGAPPVRVNEIVDDGKELPPVRRFSGTRFLDAPGGRELARIRNPEPDGVEVTVLGAARRRHALVQYGNVTGWVAAAELSDEEAGINLGGGSGAGAAGTAAGETLPAGTLLFDDDGAVVGVLNAPVPAPPGDGEWRALPLALEVGDLVVRVRVSRSATTAR